MSGPRIQAAWLGTRGARYALLVVWMLGVWAALLRTPTTHVWPIALGIALQGCCIVVLSTPGDARLSFGQALFCAGTALLAALLALPLAAPPADLWSFNFPCYLLGLLTTRGHVRWGSGGGAALVGVAAAYEASLGAAPWAIMTFLALPIVAWIVGITWRWAITTALEHERRDLAAASAAELAVEAAQAAAARDQALIDDVWSEAGPVLTQIHQGCPIGEARAREITTVEEGIRDQIRSPGLRHPLLDAAVRQARLRGVTVTLLGTESPHRSPVEDPLAREIVALIEPVGHGTITIREHPSGQRFAVSVLVHADGEAQRHTLAPGRQPTR